MKYLGYVIVLLFLSSCGTTGHIKFYNFSGSKYEVEKDLIKIINKDSVYVVPEKWIEGTKVDYLERFYVYFKSKPEEIYQIGFTDSASWKYSPVCRLGIVSQFNGDSWKYESELNNKEIERITKRFEEAILSKIKYNYYKSD